MALVGPGEIAAALHLESRSRIDQLVKEGMPKASRGRYDLGACLVWYVQYLQSILGKNRRGGAEGDVEPNGNGSGSWRSERARMMAAEATLREMDVARRRGETITVDEAARLWEDAIAQVRARMISTVSSHAPKFVGLKSIKQASAILTEAVYAALAEVEAYGDEVEGGGGRADGSRTA